MSVTTRDPLTQEHIQVFIKEANQLGNNKIFFDKSYAKKLNLMDTYFDLAKHYLGKEFLYLQDAESVRLYIKDVFGIKYLNFFQLYDGEIMLDMEHALVFYHKVKAENHAELGKALGLFYFIVGHQLDDEILTGKGSVGKNSTKNYIKPFFELHVNQFRWKRCNFILKKYMLHFSKEEGYMPYYFEQKSVNHVSYLVSQGMTLAEAKEYVKNLSGGIFFTFLPPEIENSLLPLILSNGFDVDLMDGFYAQSLIVAMDKLQGEGQSLSEVHNVYNKHVKPITIEMVGMVLKHVRHELSQTGFDRPEDVKLYHISPQRFGINLRKGLTLEEAMPSLQSYFKEVGNFKHEDSLLGEHL